MSDINHKDETMNEQISDQQLIEARECPKCRELQDIIDRANNIGYGTAITIQIERIQSERDEVINWLDYLDRHVVDPVLEQGDCTCDYERDGSVALLCPVCACKNFRDSQFSKFSKLGILK